jgi:hypothetical protein
LTATVLVYTAKLAKITSYFIMTKYLYLFRGGSEGYSKLTPEELAQDTQNWMNWMGGIAQKGMKIEGLPIARAGKVVSSSDIKDSTFGSGDDVVSGYILLEAENIEQAINESKNCPIVALGGTVEIREVLSM